MKTFNRGRLSLGVVFILLGVVFPMTYEPFPVSPAAWVAVGVLVVMGAVEIVLSRSHKFARWEEIRKTDERNQLIRQKTYAAALHWTRYLCLVGIIAAGYLAVLTGNQAWLDNIPGFLDALVISGLVQLVAWLYYRAKT